MQIRTVERNGRNIGEVVSEKVEISCVRDALDVMANADYLGARSLVVNERNIAPAFFNLKTGIAGEILQKYGNYAFRLAIVGEFGKYRSNALNAFIIECNRGRHIFFVKDRERAFEALTGKE